MTKNLNVDEFGITELNQTESKELGGGGWFIPALAAAAIYQIMADWDNFKRGLAGQPEVEQCCCSSYAFKD